MFDRGMKRLLHTLVVRRGANSTAVRTSFLFLLGRLARLEREQRNTQIDNLEEHAIQGGLIGQGAREQADP